MDDSTLSLVRACVAANVPALIWGSPGIGKTAQIDHTLTRDGYLVRVITGNVRMPEDFGGLPHLDPTDGVRLIPPRWAVELSEADRAVIVLDELTTSTPAVQAAMLRLVQERYAGDYRLGDQVRIIAIANPPDQAAAGWSLAPPLSNRFVHVDAGVDADRWIDGMTVGWDNATPPDIQLSRSAVLSPVVGYIAAQRHRLAPGIPPIPAEAGRAWPSARSWAMLDEVWRWCPDDAVRMLAAVGAVGATQAAEFMTWARHADLPHPTRVLAPDYRWADLRADQVYAILATLVAWVRDHRTDWDAAWAAIAECATVHTVDVAMHAARQMMTVDESLPVPATPMMLFADMIRTLRP